MLRNSIKKSYISACANGELDRLKSLVLKYDGILKLMNEVGNGKGKNGIYYSIKNLKYNTTDYLLSMGLRTDITNIRSVIYQCGGSFGSYLFLKHYDDSIYSSKWNLEAQSETYEDWLFNYYKSYCFNNNNLDRLYKIMESNGITLNKETLVKTLQEYKKSKGNSTPAYLSNIRDLQLKILLYN